MDRRDSEERRGAEERRGIAEQRGAVERRDRWVDGAVGRWGRKPSARGKWDEGWRQFDAGEAEFQGK